MSSADKLNQEFLKYIQQPLEKWGMAEGSLLIAQQEYPKLNIKKYLGSLEKMAKEMEGQWDGSRAPREKISKFNEWFFGQMGFHGNQEDYYDPRNSYLPDVIDRQTGIPISLSALYLELAWRTSFGLFGINFPGRFLVAWKESESDFRKNVYIDVFDKGRALSESDLQGLLNRFEGGLKLEPANHLRNAGVKDILHRMLANLKAIHAAQGKMDRALWTAEWMILLKSNDFSSLRDKGMFLFSLGRLEEAEKALLQYLEDTKRPADYTAIWKALYSIRAQNPSHLN